MADQLTGLLSPFLKSRRIAIVRPHLTQGELLDVGCGTGKLAHYVDATRYVGIDRDPESIAAAQKRFPKHKFLTVAEFSESRRESLFDQIVGLAVIEHVDDPQGWLGWLRTLLKPGGTIVLTTPHPSGRRLHESGARIGLFSREAAKEHRDLIDHDRLQKLAAASGLRIDSFETFLFGFNQLFVLVPEPGSAI